MKERITHSAILRNDGVISIGKSHADIIKESPLGTCKAGSSQGFITSIGRFVDRKEALRIAIESKQIDSKLKIIRRVGLLSENLWADSNYSYSSKKGYFMRDKNL